MQWSPLPRSPRGFAGSYRPVHSPRSPGDGGCGAHGADHPSRDGGVCGGTAAGRVEKAGQGSSVARRWEQMDSQASPSSLEEEWEGVRCGRGAGWRELVPARKRNLDQIKGS